MDENINREALRDKFKVLALNAVNDAFVDWKSYHALDNSIFTAQSELPQRLTAHWMDDLGDFDEFISQATAHGAKTKEDYVGYLSEFEEEYYFPAFLEDQIEEFYDWNLSKHEAETYILSTLMNNKDYAQIGQSYWKEMLDGCHPREIIRVFGQLPSILNEFVEQHMPDWKKHLAQQSTGVQSTDRPQVVSSINEYLADKLPMAIAEFRPNYQAVNNQFNDIFSQAVDSLKKAIFSQYLDVVLAEYDREKLVMPEEASPDVAVSAVFGLTLDFPDLVERLMLKQDVLTLCMEKGRAIALSHLMQHPYYRKAGIGYWYGTLREQLNPSPDSLVADDDRSLALLIAEMAPDWAHHLKPIFNAKGQALDDFLRLLTETVADQFSEWRLKHHVNSHLYDSQAVIVEEVASTLVQQDIDDLLEYAQVGSDEEDKAVNDGTIRSYITETYDESYLDDQLDAKFPWDKALDTARWELIGQLAASEKYGTVGREYWRTTVIRTAGALVIKAANEAPDSLDNFVEESVLDWAEAH